ncbi:MAG TPA: transglycosylase [Xanthobacteraceae bacterium]|nr:transglycosylase [Xanthobacteraceae bacterium]
MAITAVYQIACERTPSAVPPDAGTETQGDAQLSGAAEPPAMPDALSQRGLMSDLPAQREALPPREGNAAIDSAEEEKASLEEDHVPVRDYSRDPMPAKQDLSYLVYYVYAELPPDRKPANIVLDSLKSVPIGRPVEEIRRASDAFGLDFSFMKAVAKIESDFDAKQRTGSYIGLFQLSHYEFGLYGSGEITSPRDNAIAAAYKFLTEATLFQWDTHRKPTRSDLYLIHQQGWQGAAEHVSHPERIAWKSMCATDEGKEKGEKWCKRAIWGNTLPAIKHIWKSVENLTSGAFISMWRQRVEVLHARYAETTVGENKH